MKTRHVILCALFAALTAVGILIKIPIPGTPMMFTLQTFFVFLAGLFLEARYALISQLVYAAVGLIGVPVFMNGGGFAYVLEPSFGFILGFCVCAFLVSLLVRRNIIKLISKQCETSKPILIVRIVGYTLVSLIGLYIIGIVYMYLILNLYLGKGVTAEYLIFTANGIFILIDALKFAVAVPLGIAVLRRVPAMR